jgi:hypothetical protein
MKQKVTDYMTRSDAYIIIQDLHQIHNNYIEHLLKTIVTEITKTLDELLNRQCISEIQLQQMKMDPSRLRLDFLSFQPDPRYVCIVVILLSSFHFSFLLFFYDRC